MSIKKKYSYLLFRHYGQGFLLLAYLFQLLYLVRIGFNHVNEMFFLGFRGENNVPQISVLSVTMTVAMVIVIVFCGEYMINRNIKYLKSGFRWITTIYISIGLFGAIDLITVQSSTIIHSKDTLIAFFTYLLFRRYVALEDKKLVAEIFPAIGNRDRNILIEQIPNVQEAWRPYIKNLSCQRERHTKQSLNNHFGVWGISQKYDSFTLSFRIIFTPFYIKLHEINMLPNNVARGVLREHKEE